MSCTKSFTITFIRPPVLSSTKPARNLISRGLRTRATTGIPAPDNAATPNEMHSLKLRTLEGMPFQTYQLALNLIKKDRDEKIVEINEQRQKIANALKKPQAAANDRSIKAMQKHLEYLRIQADINNPRVKYNFDRGIIGTNRPVYRFLMDRKWREYRRPVLMQRLTQMHVMPDVLPKIDPIVDVQVRFQGRDVQPGAFVDSAQSERPPTFKVIPFQQGQMLCTVAIVDPDVPDFQNDKFNYRLHWLVSNIPISPTQTQAIGTQAKPSDTLVEWLPPHVQKGSPYHRYAMLVFRQPGKIDSTTLGGEIKRDGFNLRSFQAKQNLENIGAFMWRAQWDDNMKDVMQRNALPGWDMMFVRQKN
ncbi:phosphatidylethanolamine-binding protein [Geopyxis carbonaria]|nr:phosphatidylethanolamine-binding protein [Geopyxis carbonaria]